MNVCTISAPHLAPPFAKNRRSRRRRRKKKKKKKKKRVDKVRLKDSKRKIRQTRRQ